MKRMTIEIDEAKIREGMRVTGLKTRRELIDFALAELIRRNRRKELLKLRGKVAFWPGYDNAKIRGG